ncbi:MAG: hypothetical protein NVSMB51_01650 [Solirubrobacteraceae bacterium]
MDDFPAANLPEPRADRTFAVLAIGLLLAGAAVLFFALGGGGDSRLAAPAPLAITLPAAARAPTPVAGLAPTPAEIGAAAIVQQRPAGSQQQDRLRFAARTRTHIGAAWVASFYPVYAVAARAFSVNWLLLASIHAQETAFSTAPGTYQGLNFAHCCGGPMQFNVTNGPPSTWDRMKDAFRFAVRPQYVHVSALHPSIYDDFDALMAAARLLAADGARETLDAGAWAAAYSYYGHDPTGITYADQVIARAIGWSQHGFCINCGIDPQLLAAVHAAYGAPVAAPLAHVARQRRR